MVEPVRHRQTKGAATDMFDLQPPRHTSTLPQAAFPRIHNERQSVQSPYRSVRCQLPVGRMSMVESGPGEERDWLSDKGRNDARSWTIHSWRS
jgi:hypothetical protein